MSAYIQHCSFCGDGLIRIHQCAACDGVVAVCDECELTWSDTAAIRNDAKTPADGAFPKCPECQAENRLSKSLNAEQITSLGLRILIAGETDS